MNACYEGHTDIVEAFLVHDSVALNIRNEVRGQF